jgi:hypothetical protein
MQIKKKLNFSYDVLEYLMNITLKDKEVRDVHGCDGQPSFKMFIIIFHKFFQ